MNTLKNHIICYDDQCPACTAYTRAFVASKMIEPAGRRTFSDAKKVYQREVDWERANDEIALIDDATGQVSYGIDSLFKILGNSMPVFKSLFASRLFRLLMERLYFFISYNRKVIAPGGVFEAYTDCKPSMNRGYRWAYIVFTWIATSLVLTSYSEHLAPLISQTNFWREFAICGGQVLFQSLVVGIVFKERLIYYLGNMMTISFLGALLLLPMLLLSPLISHYLIYLGYFGIVVFLMFLEHLRRVRLLELPWYISATWVLYRLLILTVIL